MFVCVPAVALDFAGFYLRNFRRYTAKPLEKVGRPDKTLVTNVLSAPKQGEDSEYLTRRIARDNPEILERMKAGEFKSVRAAAIEAGIAFENNHSHNLF